MKNLALILTAILVSVVAYAQNEDEATTQKKTLAEENQIKSQQGYIECIEKFKKDLKDGGSPFYDLNILYRKIPVQEGSKDGKDTRYITYSTLNRIFDVTEHGTMQYSPEEGSTNCTTNVCNCHTETQPETIKVLFGKRLQKLEEDYLSSYDHGKDNAKIASILKSKECSGLDEVIALKSPGGCPSCIKSINGK